MGGLSRIPSDLLKIAGEGDTYAIRYLSHGLHVNVGDGGNVTRKRDTVFRREAIPALTAIVRRDRPDLPPQSSWVSVLDLGARGDGTTDDTAAFRQAIALHRAVYVPQGTYRISDTLTLGKDTALIGLQPSQTRLTLLPSTAGFTDAGNPRAASWRLPGPLRSSPASANFLC